MIKEYYPDGLFREGRIDTERGPVWNIERIVETFLDGSSRVGGGVVGVPVIDLRLYSIRALWTWDI